MSRCIWASGDALMQAYHDEEWGVPQRDSRALWEMLTLEGFQAGLSWAIRRVIGARCGVGHVRFPKGRLFGDPD